MYQHLSFPISFSLTRPPTSPTSLFLSYLPHPFCTPTSTPPSLSRFHPAPEVKLSHIYFLFFVRLPHTGKKTARPVNPAHSSSLHGWGRKHMVAPRRRLTSTLTTSPHSTPEKTFRGGWARGKPTFVTPSSTPCSHQELLYRQR